MSRTEGWRTDLAIVGKEVRRLLYDGPARIGRSNFEQSLRDLEASIEATSDAGLEVGVMRLIRSLGDGHTLAYPAHARVIPILMFRFSDGFYVTGAMPEHRDLVWARVTAIEGRDPEELLRLVDPIVSCDNSMRVLGEGVHMLRCPRVLQGLGVADSDQALRMHVLDAAGTTREVTLNVVNGIEKIERLPPDQNGSLPIHLKRRNEMYWFEKLADAPVVYFQYNGCVEEEGHPIDAFARDLIRAVEAPGVSALVIDLRWNGGGDLYTSRPLIEAIMGCRKLAEPNALFVIAGRSTFSAAMVFAEQLDRYTPAIFVGEPTGSSPNFIGETNSCTLPYSGMELDISNLYWQTGFAGDTRPWIPPKIRTPMSFAMWKQGRDESVEAILRYLEALH